MTQQAIPDEVAARCWPLEIESKQITSERARDYLKTWGGFWAVRRIAPISTNFHHFKARPLFGEWVRLSVEKLPDGMNDYNVFQQDGSGDYFEWIDAIPADC